MFKFLSMRATVIRNEQSIVLQVSYENMSDYKGLGILYFWTSAIYFSCEVFFKMHNCVFVVSGHLMTCLLLPCFVPLLENPCPLFLPGPCRQTGFHDQLVLLVVFLI